MKALLTVILATSVLCFYGQDKYTYVGYNKFTEVKGTDYVIASVENYGKGLSSKNERLLFINTRNGQTKQTDYLADARIDKVEQVKIDSLKINLVLVQAKTSDLNQSNGIGWEDPDQIFIYSPDGQKLAQLTDNKFFSGKWVVNNLTGSLVIAGYYDTNNNGECDKTDANEILIFDLKTYKLISKL